MNSGKKNANVMPLGGLHPAPRAADAGHLQNPFFKKTNLHRVIVVRFRLSIEKTQKAELVKNNSLMKVGIL